MKKIPKQEYTAEFKEQAVKHARAAGIVVAARELGLVEQSPGFSALAPAIHFNVDQANPGIDQAQLCRHARQCRIDVCIVVGLQSSQGARYSHQNGTHIQAAMDKLQARFKRVS